jgi:hypothetical protein
MRTMVSSGPLVASPAAAGARSFEPIINIVAAENNRALVLAASEAATSLGASVGTPRLLGRSPGRHSSLD